MRPARLDGAHVIWLAQRAGRLYGEALAALEDVVDDADLEQVLDDMEAARRMLDAGAGAWPLHQLANMLRIVRLIAEAVGHPVAAALRAHENLLMVARDADVCARTRGR